MRTFDDLLRLRTKEDYLSQAMDGLQGRGVVFQRGIGQGTMALAGLPTETLQLVVEVTATGVLGTASVRVSFDGGDNYAAPFVLPSSGTVPYPQYGLTLQFANAVDADNVSFAEGDTYSAAVSPAVFPATSWQPGSVPRKLLEADAEANEERDVLDRDIAAGGWLEYADPDLPDSSPAGPWLKMLAKSRYGLTARPGTQARGQVVLTDTANAGPYTISAGTLWASTASGWRFNNLTGGTLPRGESLALTFAAEGLGSAYNVSNGAINQLVTVLPGVTVSNPAVPGTSTWLTVQGTNPETQGDLRARCASRWPALGVGSAEDVYVLTAKEASASVTRVRVLLSLVAPGYVHVYLAGPAGAVAPSEVDKVRVALEKLDPLTAVVQVDPAVPRTITVDGTVNVKAAMLAVAQATAEANLAALFAVLPIGGDTDAGPPGILDKESLIAAIAPRGRDGRSATGVINLNLTSPTDDVELAQDEVAMLQNNLTWVGV